MEIRSRLDRDLIHVTDVVASGGDPRELRDACRRGALMRVRRGSYVDADLWARLDARERHLVNIAAVVRAHPDAVVAGPSAAALHELPSAAEWPDPVTLLVTYRGGGTSEPGVRRTCVGAASLDSELVLGVRATSRRRAALETARTLPFGRAVAVLDAATAGSASLAVARGALRDELVRMRLRAGAARLTRAIDATDPASESVAESLTRVAIELLGFAAPQSQVVVIDGDGEMRVDFAWAELGVALEVDGAVKYASGDAEVLWREKRREDRLRRRFGRVVRVTWADLVAPARLEALLRGAGVPRTRAGGVGNVARELGLRGSGAS